MAFGFLDEMAIAVHTAAPPSDEDIQAWLREVVHHRAERILIMGGASPGPNAVQRKIMIEAARTNNLNPKTAILTDSAIARGVATVFNWFNISGIRIFTVNDVEGALRYLALDVSESEVRSAIESIRAKLR